MRRRLKVNRLWDTPDRASDSGSSRRIHQNKGGPSLIHCFALLRELSSAPAVDLQRLLDADIFNSLVGNHDAHGKNCSLKYGHETRLAPPYDVLSTVFYPELSQKLAM
jgi:serine/threonine-protein kinase HipA